MLRNRTLLAYEKLPYTFKASDLNKVLLELGEPTPLTNPQLWAEIHKMLIAKMIKKAPPTGTTKPDQVRSYIREFSTLDEWWRASMIELRRELRKSEVASKETTV